MQDNNLVSVVRLPNSLFTEYAGTGSRKRPDYPAKEYGKTKSDRKGRSVFAKAGFKTEYNTPGNALFQDNTRIVHTDRKLDTDPYGQPALIYTHKGRGCRNCQKDLKRMLSDDFWKTSEFEFI